MAIYSINLRNASLTNGIDALKRYSNNTDVADHPAEYWSNVRDKSYLGTPVFSPLEIKAGSYKNENGQTVTFDGIFIDTVLLTVSQSKIIEKTQITGRKGTIKEYIADGDFSINIKVVIASPHAGIFPEEATSRFIAILKAPVALEVVSPFLNLYDIFNIVVDGHSNPQRQGYQNLSMFDVSASSDEPLELKLAQ